MKPSPLKKRQLLLCEVYQFTFADDINSYVFDLGDHPVRAARPLAQNYHLRLRVK
jgi:hypothetical protein